MNDRFLRACRREPTDATPVWLLRQTGRYLPGYRELRARHSLLELCTTPEFAARLTLEPTRRIDVDAALLFTDLAWPLVPLGLSFEAMRAETGSEVAPALRTADEIARLRPYDPWVELRPMFDAIRAVVARLQGRLPVVGIAGTPFTLACYALDGGASTTFSRTRALVATDAALWQALAERLTTVVTALVDAQVEAGASAVMLFDSWVGALAPETYRRHVSPYSARAVEAGRRRGVPVVHYAPCDADLLPHVAAAGADVVGIDWRLPLDEAWALLGSDQGIMGNLDPTLLLGPVERLLGATADVLERAALRPGHIFNLGHGLLPSTPIDRVQALARYVHGYHAG